MSKLNFLLLKICWTFFFTYITDDFKEEINIEEKNSEKTRGKKSTPFFREKKS